MIYGIVIIVIFLFYFVLKAIKDQISFHFDGSWLSKFPAKYDNFINPSISWKNKWKNGNPSEGEKFWGSSRFFVMFTDLWHLCDFIQILILSVGFGLVFVGYGWKLYITIFILMALGTGLFELLFK